MINLPVIIKNLIFRLLAVLCTVTLLILLIGPKVSASSIEEENIALHQTVPVESNQIPNWPTGPVVSADSAILMELETGVILYEKNIHAREYPASTTKILTTLIASEECSLDETVSFSHAAVFSLPPGSNHIAMDEGDTLSMELCLQAILIRSANEVAYAVAEHISGTWDQFAKIMNDRARELGCVDSHFANPNGLPDENHYTSAYDLAMIGRAFFSNEMLCQITLMPMLHVTKKNGELHDANQMELLPGKKYAYDYLVGCKTGYTDAARYCLVSCAERNGMKLICVVLNDETPYHYEDTIALFDYGFANFEKINASRVETKYNIDNTGFYSNHDILGNSRPILSLNQNDCLILPRTIDFDDVASTISYSDNNDDRVATIDYRYHGMHIGSVSVDLAVDQNETYVFDHVAETGDTSSNDSSVIFINILKVLLWGAGLAAAAVLTVLLYKYLKKHRRYRRPHKRRVRERAVVNRRDWKHTRRRRVWRRRRNDHSLSFKSRDFD